VTWSGSVALTLALSFGFYGYIRKTTTLGSAEGLTVEMALLFVPALAYLGILTAQGTASFTGSGPLTTVLLVMSGFATTIPMVLFTYGARQVTMTTLGILQYIAPTMQFLLGAFVFGEGFRQDQVVGFGLIWVALALYSIEGIVTARRRQLAAAVV
jgi:chloramphenicol-sensitive protein RarD